MTVLAVMPTYVREPVDVEVALTAIRTLRATTVGHDVELLVVDDGSPARHLVEILAAGAEGLQSEVIRRPVNEGFSRTVNHGLRRALNEGKDALLVNADIEFSADFGDWLGDLLATDAAVVGCKLLYPNWLIQHAGVYFSLLTRDFRHIFQFGPWNLPEAQVERVCPVTGALQLIRAETLQSIGVYDEAFRMAHEDVDYCVRVFESGQRCVYQPAACALHHESLFRGRGDEKVVRWQDESWVTFKQKWKHTSFARWIPSLI